MYNSEPEPYDYHKHRDADKKPNKIKEFLQSEYIREMFPEHNNRATDPNYQGGVSQSCKSN